MQNQETTNEIVYTKDGVPVYTLYLENISRKSAADIKAYFSRFGEIELVRVVRRKVKNAFDENLSKHGYVTFTKPENAARALNIRKHVRLARNLKVKPADTSQQPKFALQAIGYSGAICNVDVPQKSIIDLNDDCLTYILSFLNQYEALKLSFLSKRFYNINAHRIKNSKYFDISALAEYFTVAQTRKILSAFQVHMKRIRMQQKWIAGTHISQKYLYWAWKYCRDLDEIHCGPFDTINFGEYEQLFLGSKHLKSLTLNECYFGDKVCSLIGDFTQLESLRIPYNLEITGKYLTNLKFLTQLDLERCEGVKSEYLSAMFKSGMKLKDLNIVGCRMPGETLETMISTQTELERLAYSNYIVASAVRLIERISKLKHVRIDHVYEDFLSPEVFDELSIQRQEALESFELYNFRLSSFDHTAGNILLLKNLKQLCIFRDQSLDDVFLGKIATSCTHLEHVNLFGSMWDVTEKGIINFVENLLALKFLNILQADFYVFEMTLLDGIYHVLKKRQSTMYLPLTLRVFDTDAEHQIWKSKRYSDHRKFINLSLEEDFISLQSVDNYALKTIRYVEDSDSFLDSDYE